MLGRDPKGNGVGPPLIMLVVLFICAVSGRAVKLVSQYSVTLGIQPSDETDVGGAAGGGEDGLHVLGMDSRVYELIDDWELGLLHSGHIVIPQKRQEDFFFVATFSTVALPNTIQKDQHEVLRSLFSV